MSRVSDEAEQTYARLQALWPKPIPAMQPRAGAHAFRALYRTCFGKKFSGKVIVVTGRLRPKLTPHGDIQINPSDGWQHNLHLLSHYFHQRLSRTRPHSAEHAKLEWRMAKAVVGSKWFNAPPETPRPPRTRPQPTLVEKRHQQVEDAIVRWERKLKRAQNALQKLKTKRRYYQRQRAVAPLHETSTPDSLVG